MNYKQLPYKLSFVFLSIISAQSVLANDYPIGGCSLTNVEYTVNGNGTFSFTTIANKSCTESNIYDYISNPNPFYYTQENGAQYGLLSYRDVTFDPNAQDNFGFLKIESTTGNDFVSFHTERANSAAFKVVQGSSLELFNKGLFIDSSVTNAHGFVVEGNAQIGKDLIIKRVHNNPGSTRALLVDNGGSLSSQNLVVSHYDQTGGGVAGTSIQIANGSSVKVQKNMFLTQNTSAQGLTVNNGSKLEVEGSFKAIQFSPSYETFIKNDSSIISINGAVSIENMPNSDIAIMNKNKAIFTIKNNLTSTGAITAIDNDNATINLFGVDNQLNGNTKNNNMGLINLSNYDKDKPIQGVLFGKLNISNNYSGTGGVLQIDTKLASDDLTKNNTDFITIGGTASGSTELKIVNAGGAGAQTYNKGIHIIQTQTSTSDAFFIGNKGYVTAGAYDYGLFLDSNNWYLRSHRNDSGVNPDEPVYTPDVGEYLAVETMGNTLFTSRLEDREGASQYQNLGNKNEGNVWVRAFGGHNKFKTMDSQLKTTGNSFVTQIGAGLVTLGEEDQYNLGAMTGFAYYDGKTRSSFTDRESKTKIDGYSLGLYGTWYAHPVEKRGAYIDSWVLWNKFNNKIDTPDQNQYKYDSSGITASIEAGGDYLISKNGKKDWWIQPQAQLIYQGVHADDFKDAQGVDIYHGKDNVQARMGVKTYLNIPTNGSKLTNYRPYVALNFIHNTNPYSVVINDVRYENEGSANLGEVKVGVEGNVTKNSQVWLNASYIAGSHSNQAYQGNIGWKYNF